MPIPLLNERSAPYKTAGLVLLVVAAVLLVLLDHQFRGGFTSKTRLTMLSPRSGLVLDPGSRVTYNGVEIGKVAGTDQVDVGGVPKARITLNVASKYIGLIPSNVEAEVKATTVFGNKYVSFASPKQPTLSAAAEALDGLGDRFGQSLIHGNEILGDLNPRMPQIRHDNQLLADLVDAYADASPDLLNGLDNGVTTASTINKQQANLDEALLASIGVGNIGGDIFARSAPYIVRIASDLIPTAQLLDYYSPEIFCTIRNYHDVEPKFSKALGGNGYSGTGVGSLVGAGNPYIYPDNLPRLNAHGGPEGKPGCWQPITRDLWPAPYLVMDTGASIAPYNHFGLGQPILIEHVWGRQIGENTINP